MNNLSLSGPTDAEWTPTGRVIAVAADGFEQWEWETT